MTTADQPRVHPLEAVFDQARAALVTLDALGLGREDVLSRLFTASEFAMDGRGDDRAQAQAAIAFRAAVDAELAKLKLVGFDKPERRMAVLAAFLDLSEGQREALICINEFVTAEQRSVLWAVVRWDSDRARAAVALVERLDAEQRRAIFRTQRPAHNLVRLLPI